MVGGGRGCGCGISWSGSICATRDGVAGFVIIAYNVVFVIIVIAIVTTVVHIDFAII